MKSIQSDVGVFQTIRREAKVTRAKSWDCGAVREISKHDKKTYVEEHSDATARETLFRHKACLFDKELLQGLLHYHRTYERSRPVANLACACLVARGVGRTMTFKGSAGVRNDLSQTSESTQEAYTDLLTHDQTVWRLEDEFASEVPH